MNCPKCKQGSLINSTLSETLGVQHCPECQGNWLPGENYKEWQTQTPEQAKANESEILSEILTVEAEVSELDSKATFCPDCQRYMSRAKVSIKTPFYVERCLSCGGVWCDRGEWDVLEKLGLHTSIEQLFSTGWQARVRERLQIEQERQAVIDKVGVELAAQVFELASILEKHPNGDFAAAYLMRRFEKERTTNY